MIENLAAWTAPAATMIAAVMTAANLGARVTGWGFVVFTVGSIGWSWVGYSSGQNNLLASNGFLTLINVVGIWRWMGRQRAYEDGGRSAAEASQRSTHPTLFAATHINGMEVLDEDGQGLGEAVEALISCHDGLLSYIVVRSGGVAGVGEDLRAVPRSQMHLCCDHFKVRRNKAWFVALPALRDGHWPVRPEDFEA